MPVNFCCCFYPTTIVCVDDDLHLLKWMAMLLENKFTMVSFHDPLVCVEFLKTAKILDSKNKLVKSLYNGDLNALGFYVNKIHELIYDPQRSEEISTLVVDHYMPGIDGMSFCQMFKSTPCKKIMLTGEADQVMAVKAFNDEIIDQFVMKGQPRVMIDLEVQVTRMQWQYFIEKTRFIAEALLQTQEATFSYLQDVELCEAINRLLRQHVIKEVYLFNQESEYLLIDEDNQLWWLSVKNQYMLQELLEQAENEFLQEPSSEAEAVFEHIKLGRKLPLAALSKKELEIGEWERILVEPVTITTAKETYQVLLARDIGQANLRYQDITFIQS